MSRALFLVLAPFLFERTRIDSAALLQKSRQAKSMLSRLASLNRSSSLLLDGHQLSQGGTGPSLPGSRRQSRVSTFRARFGTTVLCLYKSYKQMIVCKSESGGTPFPEAPLVSVSHSLLSRSCRQIKTSHQMSKQTTLPLPVCSLGALELGDRI